MMPCHCVVMEGMAMHSSLDTIYIALLMLSEEFLLVSRDVVQNCSHVCIDALDHH